MSHDVTQPSGGDLFCPHFHEKNESELRNLFSRVAAVRADDPDLFWFTHRPIELFQTAGGVGGPALESGDERIVSEDYVFAEFSDERNRNFAVVIEGEVGTGKSELCVALAHRLRDEADRPILRVDKDTDLMSMLTEDIPDFYCEHFGEPLETSSEFKRLEKDIKQRPRMVASNAVYTALLEIGWDGYETETTPNQENRIIEFVEDRVQERLIEPRQYGEDPNLVTEQEYDQNDFLQVFEEDASEFDVHPAEKLSSGFWQALLDQYDTPPLTDMLKSVGEEFKAEDTRPVAVFEDFSITGIQARQLRRFMERDIAGDNWDFIIAGTRDSTEVLHKRTAEDRFRFYRTNKQNSNQVLFLDQDTAVDFIRPYLGYIKHHDGSVRYDRDHDTGEFTLREAPPGSLCADCGLCDESFRDLFPFNRQFVRRIYSGFDASEQSPRELIIVVFESLLEYFNGNVACPATASPLELVTNRVTAHDDVYRQAEIFAHLAKWYGDTETYDEYIAVDRSFVEAFGLIEEDEQPGELQARIELTETEVKIPSIGFKPPDEEDTEPEEEPDEAGTEDESDGGVSRVQRIINEQRGYVDNWYVNPLSDSYVEADTYLRTAFADLIETLTENYTLWTDCGLRYNLSVSKHPFVYPTTETSPDADQVLLDPQDFQRSDVHELLRYGILLDEDEASADQSRILELVGTQMTAYAQAWRVSVRERYIGTPSVYYKYNPYYDFDDFVLSAFAWVVLLDDPWQELTAASLNDRFAGGDDYVLDSTLRTALDEELAPEAFEYVIDFMEYGDAFHELVKARIAVNDSTLDVPRVRQWLDSRSPAAVLDRLRADPTNLSHRVRFDTNALLEDMVIKSYRVQQALDNHEDQVQDYPTADKALTQLAATDMEKVAEKVDILDNYSIDRSLYESLMQFASHGQQDIDAVLDASRLCIETLDSSTQEEIQKMLIEYKLTKNDTVSDFEEVDLDAEVSTSSFAPHFQEVSDYYGGDE